MVNQVSPDTHPTRIAQAAEALLRQMHEERRIVREDTDPENALTRIETAYDGMIVLVSMVQALAIQAGRAR